MSSNPFTSLADRISSLEASFADETAAVLYAHMLATVAYYVQAYPEVWGKLSMVDSWDYGYPDVADGAWRVRVWLKSGTMLPGETDPNFEIRLIFTGGSAVSVTLVMGNITTILEAGYTGAAASPSHIGTCCAEAIRLRMVAQ